MSDVVDPELGKSELSFLDPWAFGWAALALGVALGTAGLPIAVLVALDPHPPRHAPEDFYAGVGLGVFCLLGGIFFTAFSVLDKWRKPAWHFCERGFVRLSKTGATRRTLWRDVDNLVLVEVRRLHAQGRITRYLLRAGKRRVATPNLATARRAQELWLSATGRRR